MTAPRRYSKSQINAAGNTLRTAVKNSPDYKDAILVVNTWRTEHAYPVNQLKKILRRKTIKYRSVIIAQRLKRLPTIIDKLSRQPNMSLSRMQDIGGLRVIMKNVSDVQNLTQRLQDKRIKHEVVRLKDYMDHPKDDGYRSVHFVFKYSGSRSSAEGYSGLLVEVQLRTYLQHTWATAVETMGIIRGEAYKSDMGSNEWLDFFALTSSALAIAEELPPLSIHAHLTSEEIIKEVAEKESQLMFLRQIDSIRVAADFLQRKKLNNDGYNLLILRPKEQKIEIMPFGKNNFTDATKAYEDAETRATNGEQIMPVLVAAGSLKSLKTAYPNYFLDIREFVEKVKSIIEVANE